MWFLVSSGEFFGDAVPYSPLDGVRSGRVLSQRSEGWIGEFSAGFEALVQLGVLYDQGVSDV